MYDPVELKRKANLYSKNTETFVKGQLGCGTQGMVFLTERNSAIKVHAQLNGYVRERDVYRRLVTRKVDSVQGLTIPRIKGWDDDLRVIEMSVVHVPCILDFGGAYLDTPPPHVNRDEEWFAEKAKEFGSHWETAQIIIREIEFRAGICLSDVNTGNIKFE